MGKELLGELLPYEAAAYGFKLVQHFQIYLNLQVAFEKHSTCPSTKEPTAETKAPQSPKSYAPYYPAVGVLPDRAAEVPELAAKPD